jgi:hypothetical protein
MVKTTPFLSVPNSPTNTGTSSNVNKATIHSCKPLIYTRRQMVTRVNEFLTMLELDTIYMPGKTPEIFKNKLMDNLRKSKMYLERFKKSLTELNKFVTFDHVTMNQISSRDILDTFRRPIVPRLETETIFKVPATTDTRNPLEEIIQELNNKKYRHPVAQIPIMSPEIQVTKSLVETLTGPTLRYSKPVEVIDISDDNSAHIPNLVYKNGSEISSNEISHFGSPSPVNECEIVDINLTAENNIHTDIEVKEEFQRDIVQEAIDISQFLS